MSGSDGVAGREGDREGAPGRRTPRFDPATATRWSLLWGYARLYPWHWAGGLASLLLTTVLSVLIPWSTRIGIDHLVAGRPGGEVIRVAWTIVGLALLQALFRVASRTIVYHAAREAEYELRNDVFAHVARLPMSFFDRTPAGEVLSRTGNDTSDLRLMLGAGFIQLLNTLFSVVASLVMVWSLSPRLTLHTVFLAPILALCFRRFSQWNYQHSRAVQEGLARLTARVNENLSGLATVQAHGQEEREIRVFSRLSRGYLEDCLRLARTQALTWPVTGLVSGASTAIMILVGGPLVLSGEMSLGDFVAFQGYLAMLQWPMIGFGWILNVIQRGMAAVDRLLALLRVGDDVVVPADPVPFPARLAQGIRVRGLRFAYPRRGLADLVSEAATAPAGPEVLHGVDLDIAAGETVALVGRIGSGKSTLVDLLLRLYPIPDGVVSIDGTDLNAFHPEDLRRGFGVVPQDRFLFSRSLLENLTLGRPSASRDEAIGMSRLARLDPDVAAFPEGYDTLLGEKGITLSGGQRQRACLARAMLRRPAVLVLDDTFSAVDTHTEEEILAGLRSERDRPTTLLITHRPSTMREADRILMFESGRVVETGTHEELLARGGSYAELVRRASLRESLGLGPEAPEAARAAAPGAGAGSSGGPGASP